MPTYSFASESVTRGHPDKVADQISDAFVDEILCDGTHTSRAAVEVFVKGAIDNPDMDLLAKSYGSENAERVARLGVVTIGGEAKTTRGLDFSSIVRRVIRNIGYEAEDGFHEHSHISFLLTKSANDLSKLIIPIS